MTQKQRFGSNVYVSGWSFSLLNVKKLWKPNKFHLQIPLWSNRKV